MRQRLKSWAVVGGCMAVAGWGVCLPLPEAAAQMDSAAEKQQDIQAWLGARGPERATLDLLAAEPFTCLLYTSPSPRDGLLSRMPSSA